MWYFLIKLTNLFEWLSSDYQCQQSNDECPLCNVSSPGGDIVVCSITEVTVLSAGVTSIGLCLREFKKINSNKAYLKQSVSAVELWMSLHNKW